MSNNRNQEKKTKRKLFAHLKHLWSDPVKTVAQANERKKEISKLLWVSLILFCAPLLCFTLLINTSNIVLLIVSKFLFIPIMIGGIGAVYAYMLFTLLKKVTSAIKLRQCGKCKEIINNSDDATYEVLKEWTTKKTSTTNNTTHITQDEMALVKISCVCQNCGAPKEICREFNVAHFLDGELKFSYELDELVEDFITGRKI